MRLATDADVPLIRALTREAYAKWVPLIGREPLPMGVDYGDAMRRHRFDLLSAEEVLAGLIETRPGDDHLLVVNVAVAPRFQGRGFGPAMMAQAEDVARSLGLHRVRLYTNRLFAANLRLYGRLGYGVDREDTSALGTVVHLSKPV